MTSSTTALVCAVFVVAVAGQSKVTQAEDGQSGTISFSTPDLNDEESHSPWMPDMLKCDACRVVSLQLYNKFIDFNKIHKHYKYKLPESEILDLTEDVCLNKETFENYGIKSVEKVNRLTGPGLEAADVPGVMQGGGKWAGRLMDMCEQYMGEVGEVVVYNVFKKNPKSRKQFEDFLCRGEDILGECTKVEAAIKEHEAAQGKEEKKEEDQAQEGEKKAEKSKKNKNKKKKENKEEL